MLINFHKNFYNLILLLDIKNVDVYDSQYS